MDLICEKKEAMTFALIEAFDSVHAAERERTKVGIRKLRGTRPKNT